MNPNIAGTVHRMNGLSFMTGSITGSNRNCLYSIRHWFEQMGSNISYCGFLQITLMSYCTN